MLIFREEFKQVKTLRRQYCYFGNKNLLSFCKQCDIQHFAVRAKVSQILIGKFSLLWLLDTHKALARKVQLSSYSPRREIKLCLKQIRRTSSRCLINLAWLTNFFLEIIVNLLLIRLMSESEFIVTSGSPPKIISNEIIVGINDSFL